MKKTLQFAILVAALLLLASCSFPTGGGAAGTSGEAPSVTTAPVTTAPVTTALPIGGEDADALFAALAAASPTGAEVTVSSVYESPSVTLSASCLFLHTEELDYYSYSVERLLPIEEALLAGAPIETVEGHLTINGEGTVVSSSAEITSELLAELSSLSLRLPALESALFTELSAQRTADAVTLGGSVKAEYIPLLLAPYGTEATDLTLAVTLGAADLQPTALRMSFTSGEGGFVTVTVAYSYGAVSIPE